MDFDKEEKMIILNSSNFDSTISNGRILIELATVWCKFCAEQEKILNLMILKGYKIFKVDAELSPDIAGRFKFVGFPTLLLFENGKLISQKEGLTFEKDLIPWMTADHTNSPDDNSIIDNYKNAIENYKKAIESYKNANFYRTLIYLGMGIAVIYTVATEKKRHR